LVLFVLLGLDGGPLRQFDSAAVETLDEIQLPRPIGSKHEYSNLGAWLAGSCTGARGWADSYEALLAKRILRPLGMEESAIRLSEEKKKRRNDAGQRRLRQARERLELATLEACGAKSAPTSATCCCSWKRRIWRKPTPPQAGLRLASNPGGELNVKGVEIGLCWMRSNNSQGVLLWHNGGNRWLPSSWVSAKNPDNGRGGSV